MKSDLHSDTREQKMWLMNVEHSITNEFVGLSNHKPIVIYTFPHFKKTEYTFVDKKCADRQEGITARYLAGLDVPPHDHEFYEITIVRAGQAMHQTENGDFLVQKGTVVVVPPGQVHAFTALSDFSVTNIYYQSEWLADDLKMLLSEDGLVPLFLAADLYDQPHLRQVHQFQLDEEGLTACIREVVDICKSLRHGSALLLFANLCFLKTLIIMSKAYCLKKNSIRTLQFRPEIWTVLDDIEQSLVSGTQFSFSKVAGRLGLSTKYLSTIFLKDVGLRPIHYFQRRRGQHAARLLLSTHIPITEVAHSLCYTDSSHFCNQFKNQYGVSPHKYRKRFQK